jgi:tRNA G46 methylase TrmB
MVQKAQKLLSDCINAHGSATPPMQVALAQCLLACGSNPERIQHHIGKGRMLAEQQKTSHEGTSSIDKYKRFSSRDVLDECNFLEQALITRQTGFAESVRYDWRTDTCVAFRESSDEVLKLPSECSIHVELCSGNGDWAVKAVQSKRLPFVVAVENRIDRVFLTWHKIRRNSLTDRILLVCGDAKHVVANCLPAHSAQSITVNFPEPPVYAGAASRLVDEKFLLAVKHALVAEGRCTVVTDNAYYAIDMQRVLKKCDGLFKAEQSLSLGMKASTDCTYFDKLFSAGNRRDRFSLLLQK